MYNIVHYLLLKKFVAQIFEWRFTHLTREDNEFANGRNVSLREELLLSLSPLSILQIRSIYCRHDKLAKHVYAHAANSFMCESTWQRPSRRIARVSS